MASQKVTATFKIGKQRIAVKTTVKELRFLFEDGRGSSVDVASLPHAIRNEMLALADGKEYKPGISPLTPTTEPKQIKRIKRTPIEDPVKLAPIEPAAPAQSFRALDQTQFLSLNDDCPIPIYLEALPVHVDVACAMKERVKFNGRLRETFFNLYLIAKAIDPLGSGSIRQVDLISYIVSNKRFSERYAKKLITEGDGFLWRKKISKDGHALIEAIAYEMLHQAVDLDAVTGGVVGYIPRGKLHTRKAFSASLIAVFDANSNKPITRASKAKAVHRKARAQRVAESAAGTLIEENILFLADFSDQEFKSLLQDQHLPVFRYDVWQDGRITKSYVAMMGANSYFSQIETTNGKSRKQRISKALNKDRAKLSSSAGSDSVKYDKLYYDKTDKRLTADSGFSKVSSSAKFATWKYFSFDGGCPAW